MKNSFFKSSALTAAFALIATSCMAEADYDTLKKVDITAEAEALSLDTKTSLTDDLTCVWSEANGSPSMTGPASANLAPRASAAARPSSVAR